MKDNSEKIYRIVHEIKDTDQGALVRFFLQRKSGNRWVVTELKYCESVGTFAMYHRLCEKFKEYGDEVPDEAFAWLCLAVLSFTPWVVKTFMGSGITSLAYGELREAVESDPEKFIRLLDSKIAEGNDTAPVVITALKFIRQADNPCATWLRALIQALKHPVGKKFVDEVRISPDDSEERQGASFGDYYDAVTPKYPRLEPSIEGCKVTVGWDLDALKKSN